MACDCVGVHDSQNTLEIDSQNTLEIESIAHECEKLSHRITQSLDRAERTFGEKGKGKSGGELELCTVLPIGGSLESKELK